MTKPSKYRVHANEIPAVANFEVLVTAGERARIIFQGKIIREG